jgi:hypothetical protein
MENIRLVLITSNGTESAILEELGNNLKDAFETFKSADVKDLDEVNGFNEYELVKYNEENIAQDWTDKELEEINWPTQTWVKKSA